MAETGRTYLPAAGYHWSLALYDPLVKLLGGDAARTMLLEQAAVRASHRVLDIGCGTGSLLVMIKRKHPEVEAVGLDPDSRALARAGRKAQRSGVRVQLDQGFADELPYPDGSFDRVLSSFMFHHVESSDKLKTLREARKGGLDVRRSHRPLDSFKSATQRQLRGTACQPDARRGPVGSETNRDP